MAGMVEKRPSDAQAVPVAAREWPLASDRLEFEFQL